MRRPARNRRGRRAPAASGAWRRAALALLACPVLLAAAFALGVAPAAWSRHVPGMPWLLSLGASWLPARIAWAYDRGSPPLRPGVYLGWSDGEGGELFLYGEGCRAEGEAALASLTLSGAAGSVELAGNAVEHLTGDLDGLEPHPYLRLSLATERALDFDRATLRCRSGAEARARLAATVSYHPALVPAAEPLAARRFALHGPESVPGVGVVADLLVLGAEAPLTITSIEYAPAAAARGTVLAAAGRNSQIELWQALAYGPGPRRIDPRKLTPWDAAYQPADAPGAMRPRPSAALELSLTRAGAAMIVVNEESFRAAAGPRPLLLRPVLRYVLGAEEGAVVAEGLAFGWTPPR